MDRGRPWVPPVPYYGRPPYWNQNYQQPPPYYGLNPYPHQGAGFSNVGWNPVAQHSGGGRMQHPSYNFPRLRIHKEEDFLMGAMIWARIEATECWGAVGLQFSV
ncbi:hypothetical protein HU200_033082 [Digitaria exilis]|uniref:Uncharacterized protein n=1 Tax=Digitaria exilis TaxID=1010633 RepID=A0A835BSG1_9POAL|nr:hypothetical protein HU200_033082 [Digitaria exilis]